MRDDPLDDSGVPPSTSTINVRPQDSIETIHPDETLMTINTGDFGAAPSSRRHSTDLVPKTGGADTRWVMEGMVGKGGVGQVEQVFDRLMDRRSAMKLQSIENASYSPLFLHEARVTGRLEHPNIVPVHEFGLTKEGRAWFTMKLVEGRELRSVNIDRGPPKDLEGLQEILDIFIKICDALQYAHSHGVVHCDIKPANIMVGDYGEVYIMDWGIAYIYDSALLFGDSPDGPRGESIPPPNWVPGVVMGTPRYMSPEQTRGEAPTPVSDLYAMGAVLFEMLTGVHANPGKDPELLMKQSAMGLLYEPRQANPAAWIPAELERIVIKAMEPDASKRFRSAREIKDAILRLLRGGEGFPMEVFGEGEVIIQKGSLGEEAYIIESGACSVFIEDDEGVRRCVRTMVSGEVFGETAIFANTRRTATVVADVPTRLFVLNKHIMEDQLQILNPWMRSFITTLAKRFSESAQDCVTREELLRQAYMLARTYGKRSADGSATLSWKRAVAHMDKVWGLEEEWIKDRLSSTPGVVVDEPRERLWLADLDAIKARLWPDEPPEEPDDPPA